MSKKIQKEKEKLSNIITRDMKERKEDVFFYLFLSLEYLPEYLEYLTVSNRVSVMEHLSPKAETNSMP
jgi:hypothetical protein